MSSAKKYPSLLEISAKQIADNIDKLSSPISNNSEKRRCWQFPHSEFRLSHGVANKILGDICEKELLNSEILSLFSSNQTNLSWLTLKYCDLTPSSLTIFQESVFERLNIEAVYGISLRDILQNLNVRTKTTLHTLIYRKMSIRRNEFVELKMQMCQFQNMSLLNLSRSRIANEGLSALTANLINLRYLDISYTDVTDLSCLEHLKQNLHQLIAFNLPLDSDEKQEGLLKTLLKLTQLRVFDVGNSNHCSSHRLESVDQFIKSGQFPHLEICEMCFNPFGMEDTDVR